MARVIIPATDSKTVPVVRSAAFKDDETFIKGAVLGIEAGEVFELATGAGVTGVVGVALERVNSKPGFNVANDDLVIWRTGALQEVSIVDLVKNPNQIFSGRLTDAAGDDVLPTQAHINEQRELLRLANGEWTVNDDGVTDEAVQIVDTVINLGAAAAGNYVLFRFLPAVIAEEGFVPPP